MAVDSHPTVEDVIDEYLIKVRGDVVSFVLMESDVDVRGIRGISQTPVGVIINCARRRMAESATAVRVAHERTLLLLPDLPLEAALILADGVRHDVCTRPWLALAKRLTVSGGVVVYPTHGRRGGTLARALTMMLLRAEATGGNRIVALRESQMVVKAAQYSVGDTVRLKELASEQRRSESDLLREALRDLLLKYDKHD